MGLGGLEPNPALAAALSPGERIKLDHEHMGDLNQTLPYQPRSAPGERIKLDDGQMGLGGLEPPPSPLSGVRSNQLSYRPSKHLHWDQESLSL